MSGSGQRPTAEGGLLTLAVIAFAVFTVVFGGGSRENPLRVLLIELVSAPLLFLAVRQAVREGTWRLASLPMLLFALIALIPIVQLIPLPPQVWQGLPGREASSTALSVSGLPAGWLPLSLSPLDTHASALALIAPAAMFLAAIGLDPQQARRVVVVYLGLAALGLMLGAAQLFSPPGSPFYLYRTTNPGSLVGFFANRNHEATFLLCLTPFAAVFASRRGMDEREDQLALASWAMMALIIVGLGAVHSRAGLLLAIPALLGSIAILWRAGSGRRRRGAALIGGAVMVAGIAVVAAFALEPNLSRFSEDPGQEGRLRAWPHIERAATDLLPVGAGIGAFDRVYRDIEPLEFVTTVYLNHAHNDYLETWLEAGWAGAAIIAAVLAWLAWMTLRAWLRPPGLAQDLQRAASVAVALVALHSTVDYPLRTPTMAVLFAFCCAILTWRPEAPKARDGRGGRPGSVRRRDSL